MKSIMDSMHSRFVRWMVCRLHPQILRAATLAAIPAGERPVCGTCPVATVVISGSGKGDRFAGSPEVKVLVGSAKAATRDFQSQSNPPAFSRWSFSLFLVALQGGSGRSIAWFPLRIPSSQSQLAFRALPVGLVLAGIAVDHGDSLVPGLFHV
ncbi:MAG: hypothetical protein ACYCOU_18460 [Sulfobacillus sp.]